MEIGIYIKSTKQLEDVLNQGIHPNWIMFGDYGCYKRIPKLEDLRQVVKDKDVKFHYISPKVNISIMEYEYKKVLSFLEQGIPVSINDLGLLYKMRYSIGNTSLVYLGRLLTKSVNRWVWGDLHVAGEDAKAKDYFAQNNFYQQEKIELFQDWNIKGIETTVFQKEEESLMKIKEYGFGTIGFIDQTIAAVSRACPIARANNIKVKGNNCSNYCLDKEFDILPANDQQKERYPKLKLEGTVLMKSMEPVLTWEGYEKIVFSDFGEASITCMKELQGVKA